MRVRKINFHDSIPVLKCMVRSGSITKRRVRYLKLGRKSLAMADKSSATMDGSTSGDPHSLTEIEIPKELEAVNDILGKAKQ